MSGRRVDDILLVAYLDGELDPAAARQLEGIARENPDVALRLAAFRRSQALLHAAMPEEAFAPRDGRFEAAIDDGRRVAQPGRARAFVRLAASIMVGILLGAGATFGALRWTSDENDVAALLREVGEYHAVFSRESDHLVEVPAARKAHIEAWLGERVGLNLVVPDLQSIGLSFEGARMLVVDGRPVAQLVYRGPDGVVALCALRSDKAGAAGPSRLTEDGLLLAATPRGGHLFIAVGTASSPLVPRLAERLPDLMTNPSASAS